MRPAIATLALEPAAIADRLGNVLPELRRLAAEADRTSRFPRAALAVLRGVGAFDAAARLEEPPADALFTVLRLIGRADLSLGRIFEGHVNAVRLIGWYGDARQSRRLADELRDGRVFGVWATEPPPGVHVSDGVDQRLQGAKSFATGALGLDRVVITVRDIAGAVRLAIVPLDSARADASGWRTRGMRATGSGLYDFSGVAMRPDMWLGQVGDYTREPRFTGGAWRFTAVQLGAAERLVMLLRDHLNAGEGRDDPLKRAHFARAVVQARTAGLWVREAARLTEAQAPEGVALALMARGVVERAGLDVMEIAARVIGTRAFFDDQEVDRITRDLGLYLRQAHPDRAVDRAAQAWLGPDPWTVDPWW